MHFNSWFGLCLLTSLYSGERDLTVHTSQSPFRLQMVLISAHSSLYFTGRGTFYPSPLNSVMCLGSRIKLDLRRNGRNLELQFCRHPLSRPGNWSFCGLAALPSSTGAWAPGVGFRLTYHFHLDSLNLQDQVPLSCPLHTPHHSHFLLGLKFRPWVLIPVLCPSLKLYLSSTSHSLTQNPQTGSAWMACFKSPLGRPLVNSDVPLGQPKEHILMRLSSTTCLAFMSVSVSWTIFCDLSPALLAIAMLRGCKIVHPTSNSLWSTNYTVAAMGASFLK